MLKVRKKLALRQETVRRLTDNQLAHAVGGLGGNYRCTGGLSGCGETWENTTACITAVTCASDCICPTDRCGSLVP